MVASYNSDYNYATSSDTERNFRTVKKDVFENKIVRVDKFVKGHLKYLGGMMKLKSSKGIIEAQKRNIDDVIDSEDEALKKFKSKIKNAIADTDGDDDISIIESKSDSDQENWRNRNPPAKKVRMLNKYKIAKKN